MSDRMNRHGIVLSCEHATFAYPAGEHPLGVTDAVLESHRSWDLGALDMAESLAVRLRAPLVRSSHSRLLVDLNRSASNPDSVPTVSFGLPVPGNQKLSLEERMRRLDTYHTPY